MPKKSGDERLIEFSALEIGGRLSGSPSEELVNSAFDTELANQLDLIAPISTVDLSHTVVAMDAGIIPPGPGSTLLKALCRLQNTPDDFKPSAVSGDLYTNRETWLVANTDAAVWLGAGRARRETITTAFYIKLRDQLLDLCLSLITLVDTVASRAAYFNAAIMPDYTYFQSAQPTTFGHYLLSSVYSSMRDLERLQAAYKSVNRSPAGCGSTVGSRIALDRLKLGELMGFEALFDHCRDAMWPADIPIEICCLATSIMINLDRLAEDLIIFNSREFGLIELNDRHCRASKIMPQKKNPFALTHIRGVANEMIGHLSAVAVMGRMPSGQPDSRITIYGLLPESLQKTNSAVILFSQVIQDLRFDEARALQLTDDGLICSTDLAETLVNSCSMSFRDAHKLVGNMVREQRDTGKKFAETTVEDISSTAERLGFPKPEITKTELQDALSLTRSVHSKTGIGGCSESSVNAMIEECKQRSIDFRVWRERKKQLLDKSDKLLRREICRHTMEG